MKTNLLLFAFLGIFLSCRTAGPIEQKKTCYFYSELALCEILSSKPGSRPGGWLYGEDYSKVYWNSSGSTSPDIANQLGQGRRFIFSVDRSEKNKIYRIYPDANCLKCF